MIFTDAHLDYDDATDATVRYRWIVPAPDCLECGENLSDHPGVAGRACVVTLPNITEVVCPYCGETAGKVRL